MSKHREFVSRVGWARKIRQTAVSLLAVGGFIGVATLATVPVTSSAGAASVRPADAGAPCTFTIGSQSTSGTTASPGILTGVNNNSSLSVVCNGLNPADSYGIFQTSPLAVVTQPFNLSVLGSEADILGGINTLASPNASGTYNGTITVGTSAGGGFSSGGNLGSTVFNPDPNAVCPPSQAEINAGLSTCIVAIANITATTAVGATPSQADFAGEALLDFTGQGTPQSPPTVAFQPAARRSRPQRDAVRRRRINQLVGRRLVGRRLPERATQRRSVLDPRHPTCSSTALPLPARRSR